MEFSESYKPTLEEIKKAEDFMSEKKKANPNIREESFIVNSTTAEREKLDSDREKQETEDSIKIKEIMCKLNGDLAPEVMEKRESEAIIQLEEFPDLWTPKKIELLLVVGDFKKATEIEFESEEWYDDGENRKVNEKAVQEFEELNKKLGLIFEKQTIVTKSNRAYSEDEYQYVRNIERTTYLVAKTKDDIEKLRRADAGEDSSLYGEVYGFPKTSIDAFNNDEIAGINDIPENIRKSEAYIFTTFMLSKNNWKEELETVKQWSDFVKKVSPKIHKEQMRIMKEIVENRECKIENIK